MTLIRKACLSLWIDHKISPVIIDKQITTVNRHDSQHLPLSLLPFAFLHFRFQIAYINIASARPELKTDCGCIHYSVKTGYKTSDNI